MRSHQDNAGPQNGDPTPPQPPPLPSNALSPPLPKINQPPPPLNREADGLHITMKAKLMICLIALSVALAGYVSCLLASHIRWTAGLLTAPAILPGLSFGLTIAAWLLHRGWIGRGKAVGLAVGSAVAYFAAYWTAIYTFAFCGTGMILSTRLSLFHTGMIAGLVGTALLIASLATVSSDFRRKDWKALFLIGVAAGGALCLAGIGASSTDTGTLANPGGRLFIFLWQLLVSGYLGMLLLAAPGSSKPAERGRIAHWAARAVFALLVASFVQGAIGYSRGDKERRVASSATSGNSNTQPSPPPQVADIEALGRTALIYMQALDDDVARALDDEVADLEGPEVVDGAMEKEAKRALDLLSTAAAEGNERAAAILNNVRQRNEERGKKLEVLKKKLDEEAKDFWARTLVLSDGRHVMINDDDGEFYAIKDLRDNGVKLTGAAREEAQRLQAEREQARNQR
jgi:hypothetical protein